MKLQFIGANHEVTGSCHYLQAGDSYMLVDYGMEQGVNRFENCPLPVPESQINFVFLTHAHIDHSGNLPLLDFHKSTSFAKVTRIDASALWWHRIVPEISVSPFGKRRGFPEWAGWFGPP